MIELPAKKCHSPEDAFEAVKDDIGFIWITLWLKIILVSSQSGIKFASEDFA